MIPDAATHLTKTPPLRHDLGPLANLSGGDLAGSNGGREQQRQRATPLLDLWADDLLAGRVQSVGEIARREGVSDRYV
jgi:hypothetical protein